MTDRPDCGSAQRIAAVRVCRTFAIAKPTHKSRGSPRVDYRVETTVHPEEHRGGLKTVIDQKLLRVSV